MKSEPEQLLSLLEGVDSPLLGDSAKSNIISYYKLILEENKVQNLTRLLSPQDFFEGHVVDVLELLKMGAIQFPALDLGSGGGVPGLLSAVIRPDSWVLIDSEVHKAAFLQKAVEKLNMSSHVQVKAGRVEEFFRLQSVNIQSVTARAVGKVAKIYPWIRKCSTWNSLFLFKGPAWDEEWSEFEMSKYSSELKIKDIHAYSVGAQNKVRKIIHLVRVPRGTSKK